MITMNQIAMEVHRLAEANPDFVYRPPGNVLGPSCRYWHDGEPGCIIGQALYALGVPGTALSAYDSKVVTTFQAIVKSEDDRYFVESQTALDWIMAVQRAQDRSLTWGRAVAEADFEASQ